MGLFTVYRLIRIIAAWSGWWQIAEIMARLMMFRGWVNAAGVALCGTSAALWTAYGFGIGGDWAAGRGLAG